MPREQGIGELWRPLRWLPKLRTDASPARDEPPYQTELWNGWKAAL